MTPGTADDTDPSPRQQRVDFSTLLILGLAGLLIVFALFQGKETVVAGFQGSWQALLDLGPLLIGVFIIVGFADQLLPKELIAQWIGGESGFRGLLIASGLGAFTPGGPFVSYPLVATLARGGAGLGPLVAFVTAWSLASVSRLPLEIGVIGWRFTAIRLASSFLFPPVAGLFAMLIARLLGQ